MKVIVSDFDLTFFTDEYLENIRLVNEFVAKGNMFIIATGRNITHLKKDIKGFNINYEYLICNDGGIIFDKSDNIIYRKDITQDLVEPIFNILNSDKNIRASYIDDSTSYKTDPNTKANAIIGSYIDSKLASNTLSEIEEKHDLVHGYLSDNWINITDVSVNKASAIEYLKNYLNIDHNHIYTIGDNINDIEMLNAYHGYLIESDLNLVCGEGVVKSFKDLIEIIDESNNN
ncbi:MAG: HAD-IIB family hydrolase [Bacilli bacterium]|nr:HAD-IIB family hydrolase [Bacilli bacterium]